jgi:hypothetical protein
MNASICLPVAFPQSIEISNAKYGDLTAHPLEVTNVTI